MNVNANQSSAGLPQETCPLCRQPALDQNGALWICDFCGCELDFDAATRRARVTYFPPQYSSLRDAIGLDWLTRRELFARADAAQPKLVADADGVAERSRFGPLIIIALALLVACVMLAAVASALVISPSIARTRRTIAELYRPTPTSTFTPEPTATETTSQVVQSPLSVTPTVSVTASADISATPTLIVTATAPQLPPTPLPTVPPVAAATRGVPTQAPPTLPPTFTPVVAPTLTPTVQVTATGIVTPTPTINPLASPLTLTPTLTPTITPTVVTQGGGAQPTPTVTATSVPVGAIIFQGTVQVSNIKFQGTEANEADEYVEIKNLGTVQVSLDGWSLKAYRTSDNFLVDQYPFGNGAVLPVNGICRIYTAKLNTSDTCSTGLGFDNPTQIWPNTPGAHASLFNQANVEQARFSY